jgi:hypothetical protein
MKILIPKIRVRTIAQINGHNSRAITLRSHSSSLWVSSCLADKSCRYAVSEWIKCATDDSTKALSMFHIIPVSCGNRNPSYRVVPFHTKTRGHSMRRTFAPRCRDVHAELHTMLYAARRCNSEPKMASRCHAESRYETVQRWHHGVFTQWRKRRTGENIIHGGNGPIQ